MFLSALSGHCHMQRSPPGLGLRLEKRPQQVAAFAGQAGFGPQGISTPAMQFGLGSGKAEESARAGLPLAPPSHTVSCTSFIVHTPEIWLPDDSLHKEAL